MKTRSKAIPRVYLDDPDTRPQTKGHHVARYIFAATNFVKEGDEVLDLMCGSGYGTDLMRVFGARACGIDGDADAIAYANANYPECVFICRDVVGVTLPNFNLVTWFEAIEHLDREDGLRVLTECARALRQFGGTLVLSTPRDLNEKFNEWHRSAWPLDHLLLAANSLFSSVEAFGQDWDTGQITPGAVPEDDFYVLVCR